MISLIFKNKLTENVLNQAAKDLGVSLLKLLNEIKSQLPYKEIEKVFQERVKKLSKGKDSVAEKNRIAIEVLLEYQKTKNS
jgi:hypothetical protein